MATLLWYVRLRQLVNTAAFRRSTLHPFSFVRHPSRKFGKTWSLMTGISRQFSVDGSNENAIYAPYLELHVSQNRSTFHTYLLLTFREFQIYHFLVCFRALKTVGTEKPANPDVSFLFHCLMPTLMGLVLFVSLPAVASHFF